MSSSSVVLLSLFVFFSSWSSTFTQVYAQSTTNMAIHSLNNCGGTPNIVNFVKNQCKPYSWSNPLVTKTYSALMLTRLVCGDNPSIEIVGYSNANCSDQSTTFLDYQVFGGDFNPDRCLAVSLATTGTEITLLQLKIKSYQCLPDPQTPTPSPTVDPAMTLSPTPTGNPDSNPNPVNPCVDAAWIESQGLDKLHLTDGFGQLLCITGLDKIPCGTPNHILQVVVDNQTGATELLTYEQVCAVRECTSKQGRFNGVLHSDAHKLPTQKGHQLTTLSDRRTVWSKLENRVVYAAQKLGSVYVNQGITYLQRRNSAKCLD